MAARTPRSAEVAQQVPQTTCVCLGDSESDIYELFLEPRGETPVHWLIRAAQDRLIVRPEKRVSPDESSPISGESAAARQIRAAASAVLPSYAFLVLWLHAGSSPGTRGNPGSPWFRFQTDAFLRGSLALSHNPLDLTHDLCWSERGVHQVWGLGIPLWQLPFAALAKLFGLPSFPDRLALGLFVALVAYAVLRTWLGPPLEPDTESNPAAQPGNNRCRRFGALGIVISCSFFSLL